MTFSVTRSADLANPYRYGFQGMLHMSEVSSSNTVVNDYSTLFRTYDARTGRWTSHDPILQPWESTYSCLAGNPAMLTDCFGLDADDGEGPRTMDVSAQTTTTTTTTTTETSGSTDGGTETQPENPSPPSNKQGNGDETPTTESEGARYHEEFKETANSVGSLRLAQEDINNFEGKNLYQNPVRMKDGSTYRISRKSPGSRAMIELGISWQKDNGTWAWDWVPWTTPQTRVERLVKQNELLDRAPLELTHYGLDVVGYLPGIGEPFDFVNGSIYTAEGDYLNAGVSYAGMFPILGWAKRPLKLAVEAMLPVGLGSTGRTVARTLTEELAMKEVMPDPP